MKNKLNPINSDFAIKTFKGGFDNNFSYIITCLKTGYEIIIDAAIELENLQPFLKSIPSALFITHTHHDHINYIESYIENFPDISIVGNPKSKNNYGSDRFISLNNNTTIKIGELEILSIHTPGHYFDSICYLVENVLFSGVFLWADLYNPYNWLLIFITFSFGILGAFDDYNKIKNNNSKGISSPMPYSASQEIIAR